MYYICISQNPLRCRRTAVWSWSQLNFFVLECQLLGNAKVQQQKQLQLPFDHSAHHININLTYNPHADIFLQFAFKISSLCCKIKKLWKKVQWHFTSCVLIDLKSHLTCIEFLDQACARLAPFHFDAQRNQVEVWAPRVVKGCERWRKMKGLTVERLGWEGQEEALRLWMTCCPRAGCLNACKDHA